MRFEENKFKGFTVFAIEGKIMGGPTSNRLCSRLKKLISTGEKDIILDFENVQWINSPGIGTMLACVTSLRKQGGDLHFVNLGTRVVHYFRITKLDTVLQIHEDRDEAVRCLTSP